MRSHFLATWLAWIGWLATAQAQLPQDLDFAAHVEPILQSYCYDCHGNGADEGGLELDGIDPTNMSIANQALWGKVWDNVLAETMPPGDMQQPTEADRLTLSRWIAQTVFHHDPDAPDPGQVTIRRLNRSEYRFSILDLFGIDFPTEEYFLPDDTGYGFDTIGDVMTVPPTLMDRYFIAAAKISEQLQEKKYGGEPSSQESSAQWARARDVVRETATRVYRRPVDESTLETLLSLTQPEFQAGEVSFHEVIGRAVEAMLVSPRFLFRAEIPTDSEPSADVQLIDEFSLASRLSFFLWSSMPDDELLSLATAGRLRTQQSDQVTRMLQDEKSSRMVQNFVGQWLQTRDVEGIHRGRHLDQLVRPLRRDMRDETYAFFTHIMREDREVIELITADYSFLTKDLADFYGVPGVRGSEPQQVNFPPESPRGGLLTHASVLMVTSNPDRTSPVKRGLFVLDSILGTPAPPAPPDVPALEDSHVKGEVETMRAQLARHRANPECAVCHDRMDPLGLGLENFDAIGRWRDEDAGVPIDASSQLASGESFAGVRQLRRILAQKRRLFYRCLTKKLMTYALGRGIEYTDTPEVEAIVDRMLDGGGKFSTMLMGIVESPQFQRQRVPMHRVPVPSESELESIPAP